MSRPQLFLAPCASKRPKEHFQDTVQSGVSAETYATKTDLDFGDSVGLWGVTEGTVGTWERIKSGDYLLFYFGEGEYHYAAEVVEKEQNRELALEVWPNFGDMSAGGADTTDPWEYLIYLDDPFRIDIDSSELHGYAGYSQTYPLKFMPLNDKGMDAIEDEYGDIESYLRDHQATPSVWMEKTEQEGRPYKQEGKLALGNALISPSRDERGGKRYENMREADVGDLVLHLLQERHEIIGVSRVASELRENFEGPPTDRWTEEQRQEGGYLRELEDYVELEDPIHIYEDILSKATYEEQLEKIHKQRESKIVYTKRLTLNQGHYLTEVPEEFLAILAAESDDLPEKLHRFGVKVPNLSNQLPEPVDAYDSLSEALDDIHKRLDRSPVSNWLADELTNTVIDDWTTVLTNFGPASVISPMEEARLQQIRQLYKNNESRLREDAERLGSGALNHITKPQTLYVVFLRDLQEQVGGGANVNQVKIKITLNQEYEVGSSSSNNDEPAEGPLLSHPLLNHFDRLPLDSPIRKFTGPPEYWLTSLQYGTVSFEAADEPTWREIEENELVFLHSSAEPALEDLPEQPSGIFGVGILGEKSTKDDAWWIDEQEDEIYPYLITFDRLFVTSDLETLDFATPVTAQSTATIENQVNALTGGLLEFEEVQAICQETNGINFPSQGSHGVFRDDDNDPDHERPRALLEELSGRLQETSTVNIHTDFDGSLSSDSLDDLHFPGDEKSEIISQIESALRSGKHIILTGPPGTGKTEIARHVCDYLREEYPYLYSDFQMTTATADWTTFDTVGGYMPEATEEDANELNFTPGIILNRLKRRQTNVQVNEPIVIDELNRADIDKAFGQLFTLLSGQSVQLPYSDDGREIELASADQISNAPPSNQYVAPESWRIFATMNTYDKTSLYEMSYAFMRRFAFVRVPAPTIPKDDEIALENLMRSYTDVWDLDPDRETLLAVGRVWEQTNEAVDERAIGPAIVRDILGHVTAETERPLERRLTQAVISYIFPQLEGVPQRQQIIARIAEVDQIEVGHLHTAAQDMLQVQIIQDE